MKTVCIAGAPRSGTTALTQLLNCDKDTFITPESGYFLSDEMFNRRFSTWRVLEVPQKIFKQKGLVEHINSCKSKEEIFPPQYSLVGDKMPGYIFNLPAVDYYIFTFRNCHDTVASILRLSSTRDDWNYDLKGAVDLWLSYNHQLLKVMKDYSFFLVNYDRWCSKADSLIIQLSNFLERDLDIQTPRSVYYPVHYDTWDKYDPSLDWFLPEEVNIVTKNILEFKCS